MAAPSPNMCQLFTGDTTFCPVIEGTSPTETCSLWSGSSCPLSVVCLGLAPTIRFSVISPLATVEGIPREGTTSVHSPGLGILSTAPLPCQASNKVS